MSVSIDWFKGKSSPETIGIFPLFSHAAWMAQLICTASAAVATCHGDAHLGTGRSDGSVRGDVQIWPFNGLV
jgi:hypothetical protein